MGCVVQMFFDILRDNVYGYGVVTSLRDNNISKSFGRFNKLQMTGSYRFFISLKYFDNIPAPFDDIPPDNP